MLKQLNILLLLLFLCGNSLDIAAQQYGYVQYNTSSGAPFDKVSSVVEDEEGFIWIGSQNGLYRFDGVNYDNYSTQTKSQIIHQLHKRQDQLLFVNDLGIYQIDELVTNPRVTPVIEGTINETEGLPFYPNDFITGQEGELWLTQSNHSIGRWKDGKFNSYPFSKTDKPQKLALQKDASGGIWALSPLDGLFYFDKTANSFEKKSNIKNGRALLIHKDFLLVGNEALHIYSLKNNNPQLIKTIAVDDDQITAMYADQLDQYIIGTGKGKLFIVADLNEAPRTIYGANEAHRVEELDFGAISEIYVTHDNKSKNEKLWICSETGLWLLQQRFFGTVKNLPLNNPIGMAMGNKGKAWVPINYLFEISAGEGEFSARPIYDNLQANAVAYDKNNFLWVSTTTPRVALLKYADDKLIQRYDDFHERGEAIFNLFPDSKGDLWFCQAPVNKPILGIAKLSAGGEITYYDETRGFASRVLALKESSRGEIYAVGIGEESYLYRYDPEQDNFVNLSPPLPFTAMLNFEAHDLTIDDRGVVWLATTDGLLRYDGEKVALIQNDILGQEEVRGVTHYANDNIWVATATKGLVFHQQNTSTQLGETEGLPAVISAYRCIATDAQGRLWAGTAEGLVYSRMSAAALPYSNPPRIRKMMISENEITKRAEKALKVQKTEELQLHFTNLSFPAKSVEYQYRLLPEADRQIMLEEQLWQSHGSNNTLSISQSQLGNYYLELRAKQPGGYQWSQPLALQLNVFLPWYLQNWFLYGALGLALLFIGYYFRFYVRQRFAKLQQVLKYSNEKLAKKEAQLNQKIQEFQEQQEELDNANSNIQTLELFIKEIPKKASWDDVINAMGIAVNQADDIDAFEIAFKEKNNIVHKGYSNQEKGGFTLRGKPFNAKTSLTCWAMANNKEVFINDFHKEHSMYIQEKEAYHFNSLLFVPFTLENDQPVVLCAYSLEKNDFDNNDLVMFRILAQFISFSVHEEITKKR
ncbi:GAF domain-containing protein [Muriicola sp. Z0-33]|uniref:ligand-binding sensor domain-containing protein n=1 Tax=Muriicola sp. Z0-33 TaxID=2816957 RepID=UPI0022380A6D|nr:GAF domain-containing protein [Muriicola sp. Z0-33]MCW5515858.1 GAF domain-containing protein [Muriicola sp. Z0-33]